MKFVTIRTTFIVISLLWLVGFYFLNIPIWPLIIVALVYSGIVAYGSYQIQWNFYFDSINQVPNASKSIALTFDDGPCPGKTEEILTILKKHQVFATFFFIGHRVAHHPELAKKVFDEGHLIGNHSHNHTFWFDLYPDHKMSSELEECNQSIQRAIGKKPKLFRPPYGVTNPTMTRVLKKNGMVSVGWTLRSFDTAIKEKEILLEKLFKTKSGDIVLLHDFGHQTIHALDEYLTEIKKQNIEIKRLDELIHVNYEQ